MRDWIAIMGLITVVVISYAFALAGEPSNSWLWCQVGFCR